MKKLVLLLLIFFTFIAFSPLLIDDPGYISIAVNGMIYELTLYTALFWILFVFLIVNLLFIVLRGGFRFSLGTWNKLAFASKSRAIKDFEKGVAAYILEDYAQAEHLFAKSAAPADREKVGYLLASSAASKQSLSSNSQHYLTLLDNINNKVKNNNLETVLVTIKLHIEQNDTVKSRKLIDDHHKLIGHDARLLSLDIDLTLIEKRYIAAIELLVLARKQKTISEYTIKQWENVAFYGAFEQLMVEKNAEELSRYWNNLPNKVKQREEPILAYCKVLAEQNITEPLNKILLPVVKKGAERSFLQKMRLLPLRNPDELIITVQKHLQKDPQNAIWLSCLAHLAVSNRQWDMAEKAFNSLVNLGEAHYDNVDLLAFAKTLQQREQFEKATQVYARLY